MRASDQPRHTNSRHRLMINLPHRLGGAAAAHPRATVVTWICGLLAGGIVLILTPGDITNIGYSVPGSQAARAIELAHRYVPTRPGTVVTVVVTDDRPDVSASQRLVETRAALLPLRQLPSVSEIERAEFRVEAGRDGTGRSVTVYFVRVGRSYTATERQIPAIEAAIRRGANRYVTFGLFGEAAIAYQFAGVIRQNLRRAELIALPVTACVLLIAFLSVAAALLPVLLALISLVYVLAIVHLLSLAFAQNVFILSTAPAIALGLGIDYSLIIVTRFREERRRGCDVDHAMARAMETAGRAVVLSGLTIALALPTLAIIATGLFTSIAIGGVIASLTAVAAACTFLPAMLALLGDRRDLLSLTPAVSASRRATFWRRLAAAVTTHPRASASASVLVLLALSTQALPLRFAYGGAATLPAHSAATREVSDLTSVYGAGATGLVKVVSDNPEVGSILEENRNVRSVWRVTRGIGRWKEYEVVLKTAPENRESHETVAQLRSELHGGGSAVGGVSGSEMDLAARLGARIPLVLAVAIVIVLVALSIGLKSLLVPIKAVICSALSVLATLGLLQLWFPSPAEHAVIPFFVPVVTFALVLGLSVDYEVFLLTRMRELVNAGYTTHDAVAESLIRTGRPITLAGLAVMAVFAAFSVSSLPAVSQLGVAVLFGVLLDITLVRWVLSPAFVVIAGRWNWWLPRSGGNVETGLVGPG